MFFCFFSASFLPVTQQLNSGGEVNADVCFLQDMKHELMLISAVSFGNESVFLNESLNHSCSVIHIFHSLKLFSDCIEVQALKEHVDGWTY